MRRSPDLVRELMLKLEAYPMKPGGAVTFTPPYDELAHPGASDDEIAYHLDQIERMGFIDNYGSHPLNGFSFACLTPAGHDFLDKVRNVETWGKTKDLATKAGGFSIKILGDIAEAYARAKLRDIGLPI